MVTRPPEGVKLRALSTKMMSTCRMRSSLPMQRNRAPPVSATSSTLAFVGHGLHAAHGGVDDAGQFQLLHLQRHAAILQTRHIQHLAHQLFQAQRFLVDDAVAVGLFLFGVDIAVHERLDHAADAGQRRAQLVGDVGHVVAPQLFEALGLADVLDEADRADVLPALAEQRRGGGGDLALRGVVPARPAARAGLHALLQQLVQRGERLRALQGGELLVAQIPSVRGRPGFCG